MINFYTTFALEYLQQSSIGYALAFHLGYVCENLLPPIPELLLALNYRFIQVLQIVCGVLGHQLVVDVGLLLSQGVQAEFKVGDLVYFVQRSFEVVLARLLPVAVVHNIV